MLRQYHCVELGARGNSAARASAVSVLWVIHTERVFTAPSGCRAEPQSTIAYRRIWAISRLKSIGVSNANIIHFFIMKIRSVLESSCPVFFSMMTEADRAEVEKPQKILVKILLGQRYTTYTEGLAELGLISIRERMVTLCLKWAMKTAEDTKFSYLFPRNISSDDHDLREREAFSVPFCHTERYRNSPLVYMKRLLNAHFAGKPLLLAAPPE